MQHLDDGSLQAWLDRERSDLTEAEREATEEHMRACAECAARAEELGALTRRTATLLAGELVGEDVPAYREILDRARVLGRRERRRRWTASTWAASVALAVGAGWLGNELFRSGAAPGVPPREGRVQADTHVSSSAEESRGPSAAEETRSPSAAEETRSPSAAPGARPPELTRTGSPAAQPSPEVETRPAPTVPTAVDGAPAGAPATSPEPSGGGMSARDARDPVVRGRVVDAVSGQPIPSAQVYVADLDVGVLTLQDGSFSLPLLEEDVNGGPLMLTVTRIGYRTETRDFDAGPGDTVFMDFRVQEEALQLDGIIVTGTAGGTQRRALGNAVTAGPSSSIRISSVDPVLEDGGAWSLRPLAEAEAAVAFRAAVVPELEIRSVEVGRLGGVAALRIRQALGADATLTLLEAEAPLTLDGAATLDSRTVSLTRRGGVSIVGAAAVPLDSLDALLERVR